MADSGIRLRDVWEAHAKAQEREDFADLQRELNGLPGSKAKSFTAGVGTAARLSFEDKKKADEKRKKEDEERFVTTWLERMSDSYRQAYERLSRTMNDAQKSYLLVLEDMQREKEDAARALEEIRAKALVLEDGRRVYFTEDGSKLFDDGGQEVTDQENIEEARAKQERNPNASTHEDQKVRSERIKHLDESEEQVFEKLREIEELKTRMERRELSQEDLDRKSQEIIKSMTPEVREIFDRIHTEPETSASPESAGYAKAGGVSTQSAFAKAGTGDIAGKEAPPVPKTSVPLEFKP